MRKKKSKACPLGLVQGAVLPRPPTDNLNVLCFLNVEIREEEPVSHQSIPTESTLQW